MDLANQATDRQSYFHYLREAQALCLLTMPIMEEFVR